MQLEVYRAAGATLELLGTCEIRRLSGRWLEVLHKPPGDGVARGTLLPPDAHAFRVIDLDDADEPRSGLLVHGSADPEVLPGWKPAPAGQAISSGATAIGRRAVAPTTEASSPASRTTSPALV